MEVIPEPLGVVGLQQDAPLGIGAGRDLNLLGRRPHIPFAAGVAVAFGGPARELIDLPQPFAEVGGQGLEFVDLGHRVMPCPWRKPALGGETC